MTVDIEKLRALHAATTQWPWDADGHSVWSSDRVANCGIDPDIDDGECEANAAFIAAVHESVLPLCDRVERAEAEAELLRRDLASADERFESVRADRDAKYRDNEKGYRALHDLGLEAERLRAENARLAGELAVLRGTARPAGGPGRCTVCGWPLAESRDKGCVDGDCSYRPRTEVTP